MRRLITTLSSANSSSMLCYGVHAGQGVKYESLNSKCMATDTKIMYAKIVNGKLIQKSIVIYSYVVLRPLLRPWRPRLRGFGCNDLRVSIHSSSAFLVVSVILARSIRLLGGGAFLNNESGDLGLCIY